MPNISSAEVVLPLISTSTRVEVLGSGNYLYTAAQQLQKPVVATLGRRQPLQNQRAQPPTDMIHEHALPRLLHFQSVSLPIHDAHGTAEEAPF